MNKKGFIGKVASMTAASVLALGTVAAPAFAIKFNSNSKVTDKVTVQDQLTVEGNAVNPFATAVVEISTDKAVNLGGGTAKELKVNQGSTQVTGVTPVTSISFTSNGGTTSGDTITLTTADTLILTATVVPANATVKGVDWSSNAPTIAKVETQTNGTAKVTPLAKGDAIITAKAKDGSNVSKTQKVKVQ